MQKNLFDLKSGLPINVVGITHIATTLKGIWPLSGVEHITSYEWSALFRFPLLLIWLLPVIEETAD